MATLEGKWKYRSYCPVPFSAMASPAAPVFALWSKDEGQVTIDVAETGGTLVFPKVTLGLKIQVTPGAVKKVSISASAISPQGFVFTNELEGWEVPADPSNPASGDVVIRGAIVQTSTLPDPAAPPIFTTGFFVLQR